MTNEATAPLSGTEWTLRSLRGGGLAKDTNITLEIGDNEYEGFAGCNWYGGDYSSENGTLEFTSGMMTSMGNTSVAACRQENTYVNTPYKVATYRMQADRLALEDTSGKTVLTYTRKPQWSSDPAELIDTRWRLNSLNGKSPEEGYTLTLFFESEKRYSGYDGCRNFIGTYAATEDDLEFTDVRMEELDCMKPISPADSGSPVGSIPAGGDYLLNVGRLEIRTAEGRTYIFVPLDRKSEMTQQTVPWTLEKFVENREATTVLEGTKTTITFDRGTLRNRGAVSGSAGCNEYTADYFYSSYPDGTEGPNFEDFTVTRKLCRSPEGIMDQERRYLDFLGDVKGYYQKMDGRLYLETGDGRKLVFAASG